MGIGDIAGLIAAIVFAILAGFMIYPLIRLGKMFDQIAQTVKQAGDHAIPALDESVKTVTQVNKSLSDINQISDSAQYTARNVGALTDLYASLLSKPVIKLASGMYAAKKTLMSFLGKKSEPKASTSVSASSSAKAESSSQKTAHRPAHAAKEQA